ncbi:MAG: 3-phosphoshikimate 1-carboxyvinyltransferase [Gemmataceae bacterium]
MTYPDRLEIMPLTHPPVATVRVPGSKSITNRALVLAALARNGCELHGVLRSEDTEVMIEGLRQLGFILSVDWERHIIQVARPAAAGIIPARAADLFVANSGTTMRFLTAMVSLGQGRYRLDGVPRMRERPIEDLLTALVQLGVRAYAENHDGCPPVMVVSSGLIGGAVQIKGDVSSQFLSGLLLAAPLAHQPTTISVEGPLVSWPYVAMTVNMMRQFGAQVEVEDQSVFRIPGDQSYRRESFAIEPDASAASYFLGAAAITGGTVTVPGLGGDSLQGDVRFADVLADMGCQARRDDTGLTVQGGSLCGIDVDMNAISDTVMTLAAVACFADGPTTIRNVAHIRHKETDRLAALAAELRKVGAAVDEFNDGLTIHPRPLYGARMETYNDHRMAMSLALLGLRVPHIIILDPGCVAKTYPTFFSDLEKLRCSDT